MKKFLAFATGVLLAMLSGCATIDVRVNDRSAYPALYPATRWDYDGVEMFTTEGTTWEAIWVVILFGICDGPVSIIVDTLCLPFDIAFWWNQKKIPNKGSDRSGGSDGSLPIQD
jgi:uncharacterized protein YceK